MNTDSIENFKSTIIFINTIYVINFYHYTFVLYRFCSVTTAINSCAVPLLRYSAGLVQWTQAELYKVDVTTRKLMSLHHAFNMNSDVDRLYVRRSRGGRGLMSVADFIHRECNSLGHYLAQSSESFLQLISNQRWFSREDTKVCKSLIEDKHLAAWMEKALHGHLCKDVFP